MCWKTPRGQLSNRALCAVGLCVLMTVLGGLSLLVEAAVITDYTVTQVTEGVRARLPPGHWAQYTSLCSSPLADRRISIHPALNGAFQDISASGQRFPFYVWGGTTWYLNSLGFLSPTPYGMCDGYCPPPFFARIQGTYAFSSNATALYGGGGDWPMVGFYVAPFEVDRIHSEQNFIVTMDTYAAGGGSAPAPLVSATVEYCAVPLSGSGSLPSSSPNVYELTAQVVVYTNGTIVMRYARLPDPALLPEIVRSSGLVYSKALRKVVTTPTAANGIVAYRFDPVYDVCGAPATEAACLGVAGGDCAWCGSTGACASTSIVSEVCPRGQWSTAGSASASSAGSSPPPQKFYQVEVRTKTTLAALPSLSWSTLLVSNSFAFRLANPLWSLPLFQTFFRGNLPCGPGLNCLADTGLSGCGPLNQTCVNGNYSFAILGLESQFGVTADGLWQGLLLPSRPFGGLLCAEMPGCPQGAVGQIFGTSFLNNVPAPPQFSGQLYIDLNGVIDVVLQCDNCKLDDPILTYPPLRVGLVRHGVDDASSVMIPQGLLRSGVRARFVPVTACGDCGEHGWCDESTGACHCRPGYFGTTCAACPVCWTGSQCDDGIGGSGTCLCSGGACAAACPGTSSAALDGSCGGCEAAGGRCDCGQCVCSGGWGGPNCDVAPVDACVAYSLDGCEVCGQHEGCEFCFDSTCFNPALSGTAGGYTCSYSTPAADTVACVTYASRGVTPALFRSLDAVSVFFVVFAVVVAAGLTAGFLGHFCVRDRAPNAMARMAVNGALEFRNTRAERIVMERQFLQGRLPGATVLGLPLRQISLRRLFKRRRGAVRRQA